MNLNNNGQLTLKLEEFSDGWCVYSHTLPPSTAIFLLGVCKISELYKFIDAYRNSHWRVTVKAETIVSVRIIGTFNSMVEAQREMRVLFTEIRPEANIKGYQRTGRTTVTCTQGENAGITYASATEAAIQNGITPGAMSNHLNNRTGFHTVRNMKFQRGLG